MSTPITVSPVAGSSSTPRPPHKAPRKDATKLNFQFAPSRPAAQDRNLLILFHGLGGLFLLLSPQETYFRLVADRLAAVRSLAACLAGDTSQPFFDLGKKLNLPSTAVLSIEAPLQIPLLEEPSFMFYPSFTLPDFMPEPHPNPSRILADLGALLDHLSDECGWPADAIHLLGFGQGATVAGELVLSYGRSHANRRLGSLVSVTGPLLSHPTTAKPNGTPVLAIHRPAPSSALSTSDLASLRKGFSDVQEVKFRSGEGMPRSADEWRVVMTFWAKHLAREDVGSGMGGGGEMYEVLSGGPRMS
jgi:predicted esterase